MIKQTELRELSDDELDGISGGTTNAETALGAAFISGFISGGGTMGHAPEPIKMQPGPTCYPAPGSTGNPA